VAVILLSKLAEIAVKYFLPVVCLPVCCCSLFWHFYFWVCQFAQLIVALLVCRIYGWCETHVFIIAIMLCLLGTVENHGNRDFRQMSWFWQNTVFAMLFGQNAVFFSFYNNILFIISLSLSLLCDFNTKMFNLYLCYQSHCALLAWPHRRNVYFTFFWS